MNIFLLISFLVIIGLASCRDNSYQPISNQKMAEIMTDIFIAENAVYRVGIDTSLHVDMFNKNIDSLAIWYYSIFEKHGIKLENFQSALTWYKQHPKEMADVYKIVIPELTEMSIRYENLKREEPKEENDLLNNSTYLDTTNKKSEPRKLIKLNLKRETMDSKDSTN